MASANHGVPASDSSPELSTPPRSPDEADNVHVATYAPGASSVTTLPGGGSLTSFATNVTPTADRNGSAPPESGERKKRKYVRKAKEEKPPPPVPDATTNGDTKAKKVRKPRAPRYVRAPRPPAYAIILPAMRSAVVFLLPGLLPLFHCSFSMLLFAATTHTLLNPPSSAPRHMC
jgi:hypothetical protein